MFTKYIHTFSCIKYLYVFYILVVFFRDLISRLDRATVKRRDNQSNSIFLFLLFLMVLRGVFLMMLRVLLSFRDFEDFNFDLANM